MNTDCIMDYSPFELIYEGIRHTTVGEHAKDRNLTEEQVETLKAKLLEEERRISKNRLKNAEKLFEKGWRPTIANAEAIFDESVISLDELRETSKSEIPLSGREIQRNSFRPVRHFRHVR